MGQKSLIYAFVSRGPVVLSEFTEFTGNFNSIALQCLQKLPTTNNKFTYNCDVHTFNYLVDSGFTYCVVADETVGRQIPMAFLERVKDDFVSRYGGGMAITSPANSLNKEFGSKLKEHMQYCVEHPEEISKLAKVKAQVSEVKGVMMENIEKVLDRGGKIELLVDKTENLHHQEQRWARDEERSAPRSSALVLLFCFCYECMLLHSCCSATLFCYSCCIAAAVCCCCCCCLLMLTSATADCCCNEQQ